ncbi:unnamed protein product [Chrysodeixis includens]|uniref:Deltamethrin resistance protein prag01 domain-containing protein n=1 Tax=Chrysodeixis includens TaxID=689277 RepID=A0A9P0BPV1_CHRIL|nr:unnamed protein product [Chrysodeixis includens]
MWIRFSHKLYYFLTRLCLHIAVRRYHNEHFKPPSMDELPIPRGSWQAQYDANQRKYNAALLFGIAFATGTLIVAVDLQYFGDSIQTSLLYVLLISTGADGRGRGQCSRAMSEKASRMCCVVSGSASPAAG